MVLNIVNVKLKLQQPHMLSFYGATNNMSSKWRHKNFPFLSPSLNNILVALLNTVLLLNLLTIFFLIAAGIYKIFVKFKNIKSSQLTSEFPLKMDVMAANKKLKIDSCLTEHSFSNEKLRQNQTNLLKSHFSNNSTEPL